MIRALLLAGIFGFLLGVAATFGFFQLAASEGAAERVFVPTESMGESPQAETPAQTNQGIAAPPPASVSVVPSLSQEPAGPPATRQELDEDD